MSEDAKSTVRTWGEDYWNPLPKSSQNISIKPTLKDYVIDTILGIGTVGWAFVTFISFSGICKTPDWFIWFSGGMCLIQALASAY